MELETQPKPQESSQQRKKIKFSLSHYGLLDSNQYDVFPRASSYENGNLVAMQNHNIYDKGDLESVE